MLRLLYFLFIAIPYEGATEGFLQEGFLDKAWDKSRRKKFPEWKYVHHALFGCTRGNAHSFIQNGKVMMSFKCSVCGKLSHIHCVDNLIDRALGRYEDMRIKQADDLLQSRSRTGKFTSNKWNAIRMWLKDNYGNADKCEMEGCTGRCKQYGWALKNYEDQHCHDRSKYIMACTSCTARRGKAYKKSQNKT